MKIKSIFAVINDSNSLLSVKYEQHETHELERLFDNWNNVEYLYNFFTEHKDDIKYGFYKNTSIKKAVIKTINYAETLEKRLLEVAELGEMDINDSLQTIFKPLDDNRQTLAELQKEKSKENWLRIYAIRIDTNTYIITGGAIKLTHKMKDREHLKQELFKLDLVKEYLKGKDVYSKDEIEFLEL